MVNLTRIYTRTGDAGQTRLSNNAPTSKTDPRVEAYGCCDEANSALGVALTLGVDAKLRGILNVVQNELFDVGADLSNPIELAPKVEPLRVIEASIDRIEAWCDELNAELPNLRSFVLPGGHPLAAQLNVCRTVVRRAERRAWAAAERYGLSSDAEPVAGGVNSLAIHYLNRLADLLFIAARYANAVNETPEVLWVSGGERHPEAAPEV